MNAATSRATNLRAHLNALSLELAACQTRAEVRAVKVAIRTAEFGLTELAVAL